VCGLVGAMVSVNDFEIRPARALTREDVLETRAVPIPLFADSACSARMGCGGSLRGIAKDAFLFRPVPSMGSPGTRYQGRHSGTMSRCFAGSGSWPVCELCVVYAPHRAGP